MSLVIDALVNLWRLIRNAYVRLVRRPPDYVWIEASGPLPEFESRVGLLQRRLRPGPTGPSLEKIREQLRRISIDGRPRGIVLRVRGLDAGWAALEELRRELAAFRERGGRVVAYLVEADSRSYYLACAADEILATPLATIGVVGVRTRVNFLRDALDRIGLEAEVVAVSPYKSAGDPFVRNDFSEESREQAERLLDRRYEELVGAIAQARRISPEEARARIDRAPYGAPEALARGLLDGVCYEDELPERLGAGGERAALAGWAAAYKTLRVPYRRSLRRRVGLVSLSGAIVRGKNRKIPIPLPIVGGEQAGSESVVAALRLAEKNRRVAENLYEKLGVNPVALERGDRSGLLDPSRPPTPDEIQVLEGQIGFIYGEFKDRVSRGRSMETADLEKVAAGRVWTGAEALELGLADEVGGFQEALRKARELGKIEREAPEVLLKIAPP